MEQLKGINSSKENDEQILQRWEKLGFLEGIPSKDKFPLAKLYQEAAECIINGVVNVSEFMNAALFALIRRLYVNGKFPKNIKMSTFIEKVSKSENLYFQKADERHGKEWAKEMDRCAEAIALMSEEIDSILK